MVVSTPCLMSVISSDKFLCFLAGSMLNLCIFAGKNGESSRTLGVSIRNDQEPK